ncbi:uncharacterized protein LOC113235994 [Hyposmocoma kahamanoa]|uniref:uncharacterized protein LOC113235994 n=1 Tax=Hyposmocoma kahamanoa TaxID=1477025 RepID=UPI000E6DA4E5|nr:uncharacterized protein LOC113235994 [Hyposmocoma kahamanoa]
MCCNPFFDVGCGHAVASGIYQAQRLALCCAAAAIAACLLVTLLIIGGVGVGVGYHYCVVESKTYELDLQTFRKKYTQPSVCSEADWWKIEVQKTMTHKNN